MTEPTKPARRPTRTVCIWTESIELLDRILSKNAEHPTRSHRRTRAEQLHHLIVAEAVRQKLIEAED